MTKCIYCKSQSTSRGPMFPLRKLDDLAKSDDLAHAGCHWAAETDKAHKQIAALNTEEQLLREVAQLAVNEADDLRDEVKTLRASFNEERNAHMSVACEYRDRIRMLEAMYDEMASGTDDLVKLIAKLKQVRTEVRHAENMSDE